MIAYEEFKSARNNFGKLIYQLQPKTKTLLRKLDSILIIIIIIYIYIYIYI